MSSRFILSRLACILAILLFTSITYASEYRSLVAMNLQSDKVSPDILKEINDNLRKVLQKKSGASLITPEEIEKLTQFGKESERLACTQNKKCLMKIANEAKGDLVFDGSIGQIGKTWTVTLYLLDVKQGKVAARVVKNTQEDEELVQIAMQAATLLLKELKGITGAVVIRKEELGPNPKIAVMNFQASGVEKSLAHNITEIVTVELKQFQGFQVISHTEISTMLSFEGVKQSMGCSDEGCMAEIGNALGVNYIVNGNIGKIEETYLVNLKVIDIREAKIIGREQESFVGPADDLLPAARFALRRVFGAPFQGEGLMKLSVSEKEAEVLFNGDSLGQSPKLKNPGTIKVGKYRLSAKKEDFFPLERDVFIEPSRQIQVNLTLIQEPPEWWETWWFWTTVGVLVAGGVTTGVVLGTMKGNQPETGSGTVIVQEKILPMGGGRW